MLILPCTNWEIANVRLFSGDIPGYSVANFFIFIQC